jgi:hypothetical protein
VRRFLQVPLMKKIECFVILAMTVMALLAVAPSGARNTGVATVVALRSVGLINDQMLAARRADVCYGGSRLANFSR